MARRAAPPPDFRASSITSWSLAAASRVAARSKIGPLPVGVSAGARVEDLLEARGYRTGNQAGHSRISQVALPSADVPGPARCGRIGADLDDPRVCSPAAAEEQYQAIPRPNGI